jgi:hypothetical protein
MLFKAGSNLNNPKPWQSSAACSMIKKKKERRIRKIKDPSIVNKSTSQACRVPLSGIYYSCGMGLATSRALKTLTE